MVMNEKKYGNHPSYVLETFLLGVFLFNQPMNEKYVTNRPIGSWILRDRGVKIPEKIFEVAINTYPLVN